MKQETSASIVDRVQSFLEASGLKVAAGATTKEIEAAERRLGLRIPSLLAQLLLAFDGTDADSVFRVAPERHIRLWSAQELRTAGATEAGRWAPAVVFADHLLHSVEFAIPAGDERVILLNGAESKMVSTSLGAFLEGYMADDPIIFG